MCTFTNWFEFMYKFTTDLVITRFLNMHNYEVVLENHQKSNVGIRVMEIDNYGTTEHFTAITLIMVA